MNEIKQANFRINQDDADTFRQYCEDHGLNQAQGFEHLIQVMELDNAKKVTPGRATEIEEFERNVKAIMGSYLNSIEINNNAELRIREEFSNSLKSKDKTISDLQDKIATLTEAKESAEETAENAAAYAAQATKDAAIAKEQAETAVKLAEERNRTITTLADKLALAEERANGYDALETAKNNALAEINTLKADSKNALESAKSEYDRKINELNNTHSNTIRELTTSKDKEIETLNGTIETLKKDHATEIKELNSLMERKISDANKDSALALEKAVSDKERELNVKNVALEKENAKLEAKLEILEERIKALSVHEVVSDN